MHNYTPNPTNNPATIPLIDDSDTPDASNFNPTGQALADKVAFALANRARMRIVAYASAGTVSWTAPANVTQILVLGYGGGGGGGGGPGGLDSLSSPIGYPGAPGGAGARTVVRVVTVVPGTAYSIVVGAGGASGVGGAHGGIAGTDGGHGASSQLKNGSTVLFSAAGARGGHASGCTASTLTTGNLAYAPGPVGPGNVANQMQPSTIITSTPNVPVMAGGPGAGGAGYHDALGTGEAQGGYESVESWDGGIGGSVGGSSGSIFGGGGGGGGGGGPGYLGGIDAFGGGVGGAGGAGGAAVASGTPNNGGNGQNGASGAGGGGGGGGGANGSGNGGTGGTGGGGGSGQMCLIWTEGPDE